MRKRLFSVLISILFLGVIWGIAYTTPIALPKIEYFYGSYLPCSEYKKPISEEDIYLALMDNLADTLRTDNYLFTYRHNTKGYAFTLQYGMCATNYLLKFLTNNQYITLVTDTSSTWFFIEDIPTKTNLVTRSEDSAKDFVTTFFDTNSLSQLFNSYNFANIEYKGVNYTNAHDCIRIDATGESLAKKETTDNAPKYEFESNLDSEITIDNWIIDDTYSNFEFYFDKETLELYSLVLHNDSDTIVILIEPCEQSTILEYKTKLIDDDPSIVENIDTVDESTIERLLLYSLYSALEKHTVGEGGLEESNEEQIKAN